MLRRAYRIVTEKSVDVHPLATAAARNIYSGLVAANAVDAFC